MTHDQSILVEQLEHEARVVEEARASKRAQLAGLDAVLSSVGLCDECGKSRSLNVIPLTRGGYTTEMPTPQTHCTCPRWGVVDRADEWQVIFARGYRGVAMALLRPARRGFGDVTLRPRIAPSDDEAINRYLPGSGFEWADESRAARRLSYTILALVAGSDRADRHADAFLREYVAVKIAKDSPRNQSITLGEVRTWLASKEAASGAAA